MRRIRLASLALFTFAAACSLPSQESASEAPAETTGSTFQAFTSDGALRTLPAVEITPEMAARATAPAAPAAPTAGPALPSSGSVRSLMTPPRDQGSRSTCATFSSVGLVERYVHNDLSEQCIVREIGGNNGAWPDTRLALLTTRGAIAESTCPYDAWSQTVNIPPSFDYDGIAHTLSGRLSPARFKHISESSGGTDAMRHIKEAILAGHPTIANFIIVDGTTLFDNVDTRLDLPSSLKCGGVDIDKAKNCPGHSMVVVGYDDSEGSFVVKNSYGANWKDHGYGRVSYAFYQKLAYGSIDGVRHTATDGPGSGTHGGDFDGDGKADVSVFRPSTGTWYLNRSSAGGKIIPFGQAGDVPVPGDYDADGVADVAVWRPSTGVWYIAQSSAGGLITTFGESGDIAVPKDYDGDGKQDAAVFRPSTGTWYLNMSTAGGLTVGFGQAGDIPAPGDYDGDGHVDVAVFRPSTGTWYLNQSAAGGKIVTFGENGDIAAPGDYDGDGRTDIGVYRPSTGTWYLLRSSAGGLIVHWGENGDFAVPSDYDGDGTTDVAVFNPSQGKFFLSESTGYEVAVTFGERGDVPTSSVNQNGQ